MAATRFELVPKGLLGPGHFGQGTESFRPFVSIIVTTSWSFDVLAGMQLAPTLRLAVLGGRVRLKSTLPHSEHPLVGRWACNSSLSLRAHVNCSLLFPSLLRIVSRHNVLCTGCFGPYEGYNDPNGPFKCEKTLRITLGSNHITKCNSRPNTSSELLVCDL